MKRGQKIGPYVVHERIGRGAMGEVWLAQHSELGHRYALKVLGRHLLEDRTALKRFEVEMEGLARVDGHPGIVRVHSAGRTREGLPWIAMEYVSGRQLTAALKDGLPRREALQVVLQVARALGHAHARGLVHRDVKPDNVLVGKDGAARLTDFGLAKLLDREQRLTRTQDLVGTPFYLAPEQANQSMGDIGPWSDVYSVGAVLYEVLVGEPPHVGTTTVEVCTKVIQDPIVPPSLRKDGIPPAVEAVCLKALIRDPRGRYRDGNELAEALAQALASLPEESATGAVEGPAQPAAAPLLTEKERLARGRRRRAVAIGLLALALAGGATVALLRQAQDANRLAALESLARDTAASAAAIERRLRSGSSSGADALAELTRLQAALPVDALAELESAREALQRALDTARIEAAREAWSRGRTDEARAALGPEPTRGPADDCRAWVLLLGGDPAAALTVSPPLPPAARAQAAAWTGQLEVCREALAALPAERAAALAGVLHELLPELDLDPRAGGERAQEWSALATVRATLARGLPILATARLGPPPAGASAELVAEQGLLAAELAETRGQLDLALESARAALRAAETASPPLPLLRARALWAVSELEPAGPAREQTLTALQALAPGLPELARARARAGLSEACQATSGGPAPAAAEASALRALPALSPVDRARQAARQGEAARAAGQLAAPARAGAEGSFLQLERRACALGLDGASGLLLSRAASLAELALAGDSWEGAEAALNLTAPLLRRRPESPLLWVTRAAAARVLHRPAEAQEAAERAARLAPGDPQALLARARALLGREVHGLPAGGEPDGPRLRADLARVRGAPETVQELAAADALSPALEAFRAARQAALQAPPDSRARALEAEARLGAAEVLLEQARRRVLGGGARREDVPVELSELESELAPLLQPLNVAELARGHLRLGAALLGGEPGEVRAAEEALIEARPQLTAGPLRQLLRALRLRAQSGLSGAEAHQDAFLTLAVDLPVRAVWELTRAKDSDEEAKALPRALRLAPWLSAALLADHYVSNVNGVPEEERCRRLARLVLSSPAVSGLAPLLAGLSGADPDLPVPDGLARATDAEGCLARALAASARQSALTWRRLSNRGEDGLALALAALEGLERARQDDPDNAGLYGLMARTLVELQQSEGDARPPGGDALQAEAVLAAWIAAAGRPWDLGPRVTLLSLVPDAELGLAMDEAWLRGGGELLRLPDARLLAVRSQGRRRLLQELLGHTLGAEPPDPSDPQALLALARKLGEGRRARPVLSLVLRLRAAQVRARAAAALPPFPGGVSAHLRERLLGPEPLDEASLEAALAAQRLTPAQAAAARAQLPRERGPEAGEVALRAVWLALPAGQLDPPLDVDLAGRPFTLPGSAPDMHRGLLVSVQPQGAVWEAGHQLRSHAVALRRLRALAPLAALPPVVEGARRAFLPWSSEQPLLEQPQETRAWEELLEAGPAPGAEELRLLFDRACALERAEPPQRAAARLGQLARALALQPDRGRERSRLLAAADSLLADARARLPQPGPELLMAQVDLRLDRAAGEATPELLQAARQDAELACREPAAGRAEPGRPALTRWSLARARALAGEEEQAAQALGEAAALLEQDPIQLVPFQAWVARDPWLPQLRKKPRLARFLSAWVPE